jgi:hypothetical protein
MVIVFSFGSGLFLLKIWTEKICISRWPKMILVTYPDGYITYSQMEIKVFSFGSGLFLLKIWTEKICISRWPKMILVTYPDGYITYSQMEIKLT